ncbi:sulfatase [Candidatus Altiarchaeota archaeon]
MRSGIKLSAKVLRAIVIFTILFPISCVHAEQAGGNGLRPGDEVFDVFGMDLKTVYSGNNTLFLSSKEGGRVVELKVVLGLDESSASGVADDSLSLFKSQFEPTRTGYPGQHTRFIECPDDLKPVYHESGSQDSLFKYFLTYANSNLVHGVCSTDLIRYKSIFGFLYCRDTGMLIEVNYYRGPDDPNRLAEFLDDVSCPASPLTPQVDGAGSSDNIIARQTLQEEKLNLSCPSCNIIMINMDLLRADYVGLIGGGNLTPGLDRMFNNSVIFEDVSAPAGETFRSNWATLTGLEGLLFNSKEYFAQKYPRLDPKGLNGVGQLINRTYPFPTILEIFGGAGYHVINVNDGSRSGTKAGLIRGVDQYVNPGKNTIDGILEATGLIISDNKEFPFIVLARNKYLHVTQWRMLPKDTRLAGDEDIRFTEHPDHLEYFVPSKDEILRKKIYVDKISHVDDALISLSPVIKRYLNDTIIILYSSHGDSLGDNGLVDHGVGYQSCVHVPLLMIHPNIGRQLRIREPVSLIDIAPTLYEMTGVDYSHTLHGISLVPLITSGTYPERFIYGKNDADYYVRMGQFKYLLRYGNEKALYNLTADPREMDDISGQQPKVASLMRSRLTNRMLEMQAFKQRDGISEEDVTNAERIIHYLYSFDHTLDALVLKMKYMLWKLIQ